jgi:hypothetical protein
MVLGMPEKPVLEVSKGNFFSGEIVSRLKYSASIIMNHGNCQPLATPKLPKSGSAIFVPKAQRHDVQIL